MSPNKHSQATWPLPPRAWGKLSREGGVTSTKTPPNAALGPKNYTARAPECLDPEWGFYPVNKRNLSLRSQGRGLGKPSLSQQKAQPSAKLTFLKK